MLEIIAPILQTGAVGAMLVMSWRYMTSKDKEMSEVTRAQNKERKEMYKNMEELVREVTTALAYKNVTDDKMSAAVDKLAEQQRELRQALRGLGNPQSNNPNPQNMPWNRRGDGQA